MEIFMMKKFSFLGLVVTLCMMHSAFAAVFPVVNIVQSRSIPGIVRINSSRFEMGTFKLDSDGKTLREAVSSQLNSDIIKNKLLTGLLPEDQITMAQIIPSTIEFEISPYNSVSSKDVNLWDQHLEDVVYDSKTLANLIGKAQSVIVSVSVK